MSIRIMSVVWASSPYRGEALLVHLALADFANDEGVCWPSQRTLAKKARCSENYVRVAIKRMITDGLVEITEQSNGRGNPISYQLKPHPANGHSQKPHSPERETPFATTSTPLMNRNEPSLADEFNQFWEAYPRKVAKGIARKAFAKAFARNRGLTIEVLIQAVKSYAATVSDIRYCAYPATWLNGERWSDNLEVKSASVVTTDHQAARSFGAAMRNTGRTEQQLIDAIAHYTAEQQEAAINEYRSK
jgi:hypothetical protein